MTSTSTACYKALKEVNGSKTLATHHIMAPVVSAIGHVLVTTRQPGIGRVGQNNPKAHIHTEAHAYITVNVGVKDVMGQPCPILVKLNLASCFTTCRLYEYVFKR